jgi:5-methyltetrahydropteroyltriglutamate--homocysteine methyltransferase
MSEPAGVPAFAAMVVGSLPRPQWVRDLIEDRKAGRIDRAAAERLLDAAIPSAIRMQERAGLDYVSDGEWRRESYVKVFADAVGGFAPDLIEVAGSPLRYPAVVSRLAPLRPIAAGEAAFLRAHTDRRTLVALPSPYTIGRRMWHPAWSAEAYPTRQAFMEACVPIIRDEVRRLAALGIDAVQLDDPWLALLVDPGYRAREGITDLEAEMALAVRCANQAVEGVGGLFLSVHVCHAHFARRRLTQGSYEPIMAALAGLRVHRLAMEFATPAAGGLGALAQFPPDKLVGLGVIDHCDPQVETPDEVVARVERALAFVPPERITLNPDCGFAPSSANPMDFDEAYRKLTAMCHGARLLRERYG